MIADEAILLNRHGLYSSAARSLKIALKSIYEQWCPNPRILILRFVISKFAATLFVIMPGNDQQPNLLSPQFWSLQELLFCSQDLLIPFLLCSITTTTTSSAPLNFPPNATCKIVGLSFTTTSTVAKPDYTEHYTAIIIF